MNFWHDKGYHIVKVPFFFPERRQAVTPILSANTRANGEIPLFRHINININIYIYIYIYLDVFMSLDVFIHIFMYSYIHI